MTAPIVETHRGVLVVRDDLFPGGTKARFIGRVFDGADEAVYASPAEGGAQTALATVARALGKRATIFVAQRAKPHARTLEAARLGAKVVSGVARLSLGGASRAKDYCRNTGAALIPFGAEIPGAIEAIAEAALATGRQPRRGVVRRRLRRADPGPRAGVAARAAARRAGRPGARGRGRSPNAQLHVHALKFGERAKTDPPFPSDPHYDAKAWEFCVGMRGRERCCSGTWRHWPGPRRSGRY